MNNTRTVIAIITCALMLAGVFITCGILVASVNNSTEALKEVKVIIIEHNTKMASLENRVNLNDLDDQHTKEKVSELQEAVKLLATLNSNIEKLLQKDG